MEDSKYNPSHQWDGGPAFPVPEGPLLRATNGQSLWDYYAGEALNGFLSDNKSLLAIDKAALGISQRNFVAELSFDYADAMIKERKKRMEKNDRP